LNGVYESKRDQQKGSFRKPFDKEYNLDSKYHLLVLALAQAPLKKRRREIFLHQRCPL
jgi:hypothetical protein